MIIVEESEALARVNSPDNLVNKLYDVRKLHINRTGPKGIPPMITALAVTTAAISGDQVESAKTFGMTQANLSYHKNETKNPETAALIKSNIDTVHSKALDGMLACLDTLQPKIEHVKKATDLANIAGNLAKIVERTSPKVDQHSTYVKVVLHQPTDKLEADYESMAV